VNWADIMAAQGAFGTDFYDRSTRTIGGTMLWTEYRPVIKIGPKGALGSHEIRPIHSAPSLGQSIAEARSSHDRQVNANMASGSLIVSINCLYLPLMPSSNFNKRSSFWALVSKITIQQKS